MSYQENPKNIQISYDLFMTINNLLNNINIDGYSNEVKGMYERACEGIYEKRCRIRNRSCFSDIAQAQTADEKEAALENYIKTKSLSKHHL